jgi:hypothetical protein
MELKIDDSVNMHARIIKCFTKGALGLKRRFWPREKE